MSKVFFEVLQKEEFEQVVYGYDKFSGLKAIIAIHNTALGPAFGGTRMYPYASEDDAIYDVLRLSKAMTYKNAAGGSILAAEKLSSLAMRKRTRPKICSGPMVV